MEAIIGLVALIFVIFIYFLPTFIAYKRNHRNALAIFVLDLLAGWTLVGYVVALVWSVLADETKTEIKP